MSKLIDQSSGSVSHNHGVPQVSTLSPTLFNIYTTPLAAILRKLGIEYHVYADDYTLYLAIQTIDYESQRSTVDVKQWMVQNMLKLIRKQNS